MANIEKLKHLEHLEDEMLNYGVEGCERIVGDLKELRQMLGCKGTSYIQTKWDGKPAVVCGVDPITKLFFVGTKSVFNKEFPKAAVSEGAVDEYYGEIPDLAEKLKICLKYLPKLGIKGVLQGDLLYTKSDLKTERMHGHDMHVFKPNTLAYAIPTDHEIGKKINGSQMGIVFHTHYTGDDLPTMVARPGIGEKLGQSKDVVNIDNDTPMHNVGLSPQEEREFDKTVAKIGAECKKCGDFLDELVLSGGGKGNPTGDDKFNIAPYVKKYFNHEISHDKVTTNVDDTMQGLLNFYYLSMEKLVIKGKQTKTVSAKLAIVKSSLEYLMENTIKFKSMINLYRLIQDLKLQIVEKLDPLERFSTFVLKDNKYVVTNPEGYVLHRDGNMVKLVNRLEFSKNNFMAAPPRPKKPVDERITSLVYNQYKGYPGKKCVVSFGRFQPPTKGHLANLDECKALATKWGADDYRLFISQKHQSDANYKDKQGTDPLPPDRKLFWMEKMFGTKHPGKIVSGNREIKHNLADLMMAGFRHIIFLAGDEDKRKWDNYLPKYNGTPPWDYTFFSFEIRSSGERSKAISGTKQRIAAVNAVTFDPVTKKPNKHYVNFKANIGSMLNKNELDLFIQELQKYIPAGYDGK